MNEIEMLKRLSEITERLRDEESVEIFSARIKWLIENDFLNYWNSIKNINSDMWSLQGDCYRFDEYIIFTAGNSGRQCADVLKTCQKKIKFFVDNDKKKQGHYVDDIMVKSIADIVNYPNIPIISGNVAFASALRKQLLDYNLSNYVIDGVCAFRGKQYFDVLKPTQKEVFIDAGAYDGGTILDFIKWVGNNEYKKIYSFEPDKANAIKVRSCIESNCLRNVELITKGTWLEDSEIFFDNNGSSGSSFKTDYDDIGCKIPVTSIDNVTQGERVSYIKMDVEGCEKESLQGARKTIRKWKPKLAVCVYHKPFDIVELPLLILDMNPDYRFYLRHYASNLCETVLYAE